jgi:hypothetical protein
VKRVEKSGNREGISTLGQVDEGLEERRERAKLNRIRYFGMTQFGCQWSVWNAVACRFEPGLSEVPFRTALVGITFWSAKLRLGTLCHPVLPYCPKDLTAEKRLVTGRRYVDFSIRQLAWQFDQLEFRPEKYR